MGMPMKAAFGSITMAAKAACRSGCTNRLLSRNKPTPPAASSTVDASKMRQKLSITSGV